jgi:ABC-type uncharacterized transport system auxiliary subunit
MNMKRYRVSAVVMFLVLSTLMGCAGKIRYASYYTLNLPSPPDPPPQETARAVVAVREFRSPAYLRQGSLVYRRSPEEVGFYNYHRWAVDPREFVTNAIREHLQASGNFAQVRNYDGHSDVDYVMTGRLERLEEVDYEGGIKVAVAISAQMTSLASGATVWTNQVSETGTVERRDMPAIVSEMDRTLDRAIAKLLNTAPNPTAHVGE